jgi:hypothetical protein
LADDRLRQLLQDVREVVGVERVGDGDEACRIHRFEDFRANIFAEVLQDERRVLLFDETPDHLSNVRRCRRDQIRDFERSQRRELKAHVLPCTAGVGRSDDLAQLLLDRHEVDEPRRQRPTRPRGDTAVTRFRRNDPRSVPRSPPAPRFRPCHRR